MSDDNKNDRDLEPDTSRLAVRRRLNRIMEAGLKFHEKLWFEPEDKVEEYLEKHPALARFKFGSFNQFFSRAMPVKVLHQLDKGDRVTPEDIEAMNLTENQLKRLAGIVPITVNDETGTKAPSRKDPPSED